MKSRVLLLLFLLVIVASCKKKHQPAMVGNYMIIGHNGGFVTINEPYYLLTTSQLLKDTTQYWGKVPDDISKFHFNVVESSAKYDSVKSILNVIPNELFGVNHASIGSTFPDVGYEDVRTSANGVLYQWYFQSDQSNSSAQIRQFINTIYSDF